MVKFSKQTIEEFYIDLGEEYSVVLGREAEARKLLSLLLAVQDLLNKVEPEIVYLREDTSFACSALADTTKPGELILTVDGGVDDTHYADCPRCRKGNECPTCYGTGAVEAEVPYRHTDYLMKKQKRCPDCGVIS